MGYMKIPNLYKAQDVLMFRETWCLEKIHGTSSHISWKDNTLSFFSGGADHNAFIALFNAETLLAGFRALGHDHVVVYGEAYGGKMQGMSATYGKQLKFVAFDVRIGETWLAVPDAHDVVKKLDLEFVHYRKVPATVEALDAERAEPSVQAIRNGMGGTHKREGIVIRPLVEMTLSNGARVIAKHKIDEFRETKTPRPVDAEKAEALAEAQSIADEWCSDERLRHVLDKLPQPVGIEHTGAVIKAMIDDVIVEAGDEIVDSKDARKAIGKRTAKMLGAYIKSKLYDQVGG